MARSLRARVLRPLQGALPRLSVCRGARGQALPVRRLADQQDPAVSRLLVPSPALGPAEPAPETVRKRRALRWTCCPSSCVEPLLGFTPLREKVVKIGAKVVAH